MVQLSLWELLSQEREASLRQPLLRELLRLPALPRLLELPLSLLLVTHGSRQQGLRSRPLARLAQNEERGCTGREAGRRGGLGKRAVTELERKHLVETDRHIAECKEYIAKQRELIERAIQRGRSTEVLSVSLNTSSGIRAGLPFSRLLVASCPALDLLPCAKHLSFAATVPRRMPSRPFCGRAGTSLSFRWFFRSLWLLARSPLPSRECQRARGGCAADGPTAGVVEPGGVAGRRGRAQGLAPGIVVPDAAVAVRRGRADAPALRVIEPSLRLGACLIGCEADDDRNQNC